MKQVLLDKAKISNHFRYKFPVLLFPVINACSVFQTLMNASLLPVLQNLTIPVSTRLVLTNAIVAMTLLLIPRRSPVFNSVCNKITYLLKRRLLYYRQVRMAFR